MFNTGSFKMQNSKKGNKQSYKSNEASAQACLFTFGTFFVLMSLKLVKLSENINLSEQNH